ncbi:hypothetical protein HYFRA_00000133 [Hymenoscyphus fraxineus]|uniref:Biotrophy-associated secreted protein 2 n=1 Tax=Hymenoscyphus fraxineus TaxID=746836 RepID=A0A9N9L4Y1_9HELO|nr:hypothetical protein HYFRA_00000133 [Hymenoscyphus fraxineus]
MVHFTSIAAFIAIPFVAFSLPGSFFPNIASRGTIAARAVTTVNAGAGAVGKGNGGQFTVGGCISDADCGSKCCAGGAVSGISGRTNVGVCSGVGGGVENQNGKTGCGFVDPNANLTLSENAAQVKKQGF